MYILTAVLIMACVSLYMKPRVICVQYVPTIYVLYIEITVINNNFIISSHGEVSELPFYDHI